MRRLAPLALAVAALAGCSDTPKPTALDLPEAVFSKATNTVDVIVVLRPEFAPGAHAANAARAAEVARGLGIAPRHVYGTALFGFAGSVPEGRMEALRRDPRVAYVERDQIASIPTPPAVFGPPCRVTGTCNNDPAPSGEQTPWGVTRVGGAQSGATGTAWVIDTGIDLDHPDLNVDVRRSVEYVSKGPGSDTADDGHGHGTHVAGTIAAIDNEQDVIGVAAGATVVAVKVLDNRGSGSYSDVIAGVNHVATHGQPGDVANMSLGGPVSQALDDAVVAASANVKFAIAAGNDGKHAQDYSPARANGDNLYTVSAFAEGGCMTSWSNYGNPPVDWAAPGAGVLSLKAGGGTTTMSGTSMAAPHVAGLLLSTIRADGNVTCDKDSSPDPIAVR